MNQRSGGRWAATLVLGAMLIAPGCQSKEEGAASDREPPSTSGGAAPAQTTDAATGASERADTYGGAFVPREKPAEGSETPAAGEDAKSETDEKPAGTDASGGEESAAGGPAAGRPIAVASAAPNVDAVGGAEATPTSGERVAKEEKSEKKPATRPAARRPAAPGEPLDISFDDLVIGMQADVVYRPWMLTDRAKEVDGQKVKLVGYIHPAPDKQKHIKELVLLRNTECKFGPGGQADHLVRVFFKGTAEGTFTKNAVEVQGIIKVNPWQGPDGNTWSLYDLEGTGFKDLKRQ